MLPRGGQHLFGHAPRRPARRPSDHQPPGGEGDHFAQDIGVRGLLEGRAQVHPLVGHWLSSDSLGSLKPESCPKTDQWPPPSARLAKVLLRAGRWDDGSIERHPHKRTGPCRVKSLYCSSHRLRSCPVERLRPRGRTLLRTGCGTLGPGLGTLRARFRTGWTVRAGFRTLGPA